MNQQPDKLFREKLEGFSRPVSADAWNRVEAGLNKKNGEGLWLRIAAAVTLLAVATIILWPSADPASRQNISKNNSINNTSKENSEAVKELSKENPDVIEEKATEASARAEHTADVPKEKMKSRKEKTNEEPRQIKRDEQHLLVVQKNNDVQSPIETVSIEVREETSSTEIAVAQNVNTSTPQHPNTSTPLRIVYSAEEINNKYLDKKSLAEATSDEKKPSTLRKLLDKAYDLKNNEDPFGDLRQKKNEILALNFKNDKQERSENK